MKGGDMFWALKWQQENKLGGKREHFLYTHEFGRPTPLLFHTRQEARDYRDKHYGYIRNRPDLKAEPYGWKVPRVCKVEVNIVEAQGAK